MNRLAIILTFCAMGAGLGCGDGSSGGQSGSGGDGGTAQGGTAGQGGSGAQGGSAQGGTAGQGGSGAQGGTGGGMQCGGIAGIQCGPTEYCDFALNNCGAVDGSGTCKPRPDGCPKNYIATCGCDGMIYGNDCDAAAQGQDVSTLGNCPAPQGEFICGQNFCAQKQQYCQKTGSDVGGEPDSYICNPLPNGCSGANPTCACLANEPCGSMCEVAGGDFTLTCLGG